MANPLILSPRRRELMVQLGRDKRRQDRKDEAEVVITQAIKIFRHHLPEMLEESPCADRFERVWPDIDAQLRQDQPFAPTQHQRRVLVRRRIARGTRDQVAHDRVAHDRIRHGGREVERVKGIEPSSVAWEATALPLSYTRVEGDGNRNPPCGESVARPLVRVLVAD